MDNEQEKSFEERSNEILTFHQKAIENLKQTKATANRQLEEALKKFPHVLADHALGKVTDQQLNQALEELGRLKELASIGNKAIETACNAVFSIQNKVFRDLKKERELSASAEHKE